MGSACTFKFDKLNIIVMLSGYMFNPEEHFILAPLLLMPPKATIYFLLNLCCFVISFFTVLYFLIKNIYILKRFVFCFSMFLCIFYQIPLVLFSWQVESALANPWFYALVVNGSVIILLLYVALTARLSFADVKDAGYGSQNIFLYFMLVTLGAAFVGLYVTNISWECSGLYALLYDPWMTLLARELTGKLSGSTLYSYLLGAYVNGVGPVITLLSVWLVYEGIYFRKGFRVFLGLTGGFISILAVLLPGIKGLLMPTAIMLAIGSFFWPKTWLKKGLMMFFSLIFMFLSLVTFEILKERGSNVGEKYDFAACSIKLNSCESSKELLDSMSFREGSLGLPIRFVEPLEARLNCMCDGGNDSTCPSPILGRVSTVGTSQTSQASQRSLTYIDALFNRIFVIPMQVSVWHFMYVETESFEPLKTLPFSRRILGDSINMPELVYQKYGSVYSGGDKTSTSTAPTGFLFAYSSALGGWGFVLAMILIVILDLVFVCVSYCFNESKTPILVGIILIMCMNFMTSDFVTTLISHGGLASILILFLYVVKLSRRDSKLIRYF